MSFLYGILALFGLGFIVFIHELGHYWMAIRVGMAVEVFSIGMGRPIYSWYRQGVKWQICWIPFGGYVKLKGEEEGDKDDPNGFFHKTPWDRIKVAAMGPIFNIILTLILFFCIWSVGGREKDFSFVSSKIGWVDPKSALYSEGVRSGDEIIAYNETPFSTSQDHVLSAMTSGDFVVVEGNHINYDSLEKKIFNLKVPTYPHPNFLNKDIMTTGVLNSGRFLFYAQDYESFKGFPVEDYPVKHCGLELNDRLLWMDGHYLFSMVQLSSLVNQEYAFLTIERNGELLHRRVPRIPLKEFALNPNQKNEFSDSAFSCGYTSDQFPHLYVLPYDLSRNCMVEQKLVFLDEDESLKYFPHYVESIVEEVLKSGDKIVAIDGKVVGSSLDLFKEVQTKQIQMIVLRRPIDKNPSWEQANQRFFSEEIPWESVKDLISKIDLHRESPLISGECVLLKPITPLREADFKMSDESRSRLLLQQIDQKSKIDAISDPVQKNAAEEMFLKLLSNKQLGVVLKDLTVLYNPTPIEMMKQMVSLTAKSLYSLITGDLSPKLMSGPVGILQTMGFSWSSGLREALFWMGTISLGLAVSNLLPIPTLDGGYIMIALFEIVTKRRLQPKTVQKLVYPFFILLILMLIFVTYHDILRLFQ